MNKQEFVERVAKETRMSKAKAQEAVNTFLKIIQDVMVEEEKLALLGFGSFQVCQQAERVARNPRTGEPVTIKARKLVKFKPGKELLSQVNK